MHFYLCRHIEFVFPVTKLTKKTVIGISSGALGLSSCFDSPLRLYRRKSWHNILYITLDRQTIPTVVRHRRTYGPLGDDVWWHLDFSMWAYTVALLIFAIPLAIAPAIPLLYVYSPLLSASYLCLSIEF